MGGKAKVGNSVQSIPWLSRCFFAERKEGMEMGGKRKSMRRLEWGREERDFLASPSLPPPPPLLPLPPATERDPIDRPGGKMGKWKCAEEFRCC